MIEKFPIMLRLSKHSVPFFSNLLDARRCGMLSWDSFCAAFGLAGEIEPWRIIEVETS